jgi:hypothetical protein
MVNETDANALDGEIERLSEQMRDAFRDYEQNGIIETKLRAVRLRDEVERLTARRQELG